MYGLPGQTLSAWQSTLENVLTLNPEHISCYGLKLEPGTPMYDYRDYAKLPDDDAQADMYLAAVEILKSHGFRQYEIPNFARKGLYSRHNMKYWTGGEYLGFGPSASSDFAGKRFTLVRSLPAYIKGIREQGIIIDEVQEIPMRERAGEYLMMRLRTVSGISAEDYERMFLLSFEPIAEQLERNRQLGYVARTEDNRWHLTPKGFLISNTIISDLLVAQDKSIPLKRL
jgi:oxygen-independent coproporphyrinogen-3 oxidase